MNADGIRLVIADDSLLLREGIARLLVDQGFIVKGQAGGAEELLRLVDAHRPDVAIVDIRMPPTFTDEGLRAAEAMRAAYGNNVGILLLSQYVDPSLALRLMRRGADGIGYLLKDRVSDLADFVDSIRRVARGGSAIDPEVVAQLVERRRIRDTLVELTARERDVLGLMAEGRSNAAIGQGLFLAPKTVEGHIASIFSKLGLEPVPEDHRRVLAVLAYLRSA